MTTNINLRIPRHLKEQIEDLGFKNEKSISEITRSIIEEFFSDSNNLIDTQPYLNRTNNSEKIDFVQTLGFTELIFWIFEKRFNPEIDETDEFHFQLINEIDKLNRHHLFTDEIKNEFNKVAEEINNYLLSKPNTVMRFNFCKKEAIDGFNYQLFFDFFHCLRYDNDNNRILTIQ